MDDNELDAALRAADPVARAEVDDLGAAALFGRLRDSEGRLDRAPFARRGPRRRLAVTGIVGAVALGVAIPAAASVLFGAQTGEYPPLVNDDGTLPTETDDTERIDLAADDFVEYTATIYPFWIGLPAGIDSDSVRIAAATEMSQEARSTVSPSGATGGVSQVTGLVSGFEYDARCLWIDYYLTATTEGEQSRQAHAADVIRGSLAWPATVASDGGNSVEHLSAIADAAEAGDTDVVRREFDQNCRVSLEEFGR
jgi:hypothetical protein